MSPVSLGPLGFTPSTIKAGVSYLDISGVSYLDIYNPRPLNTLLTISLQVPSNRRVVWSHPTPGYYGAGDSQCSAPAYFLALRPARMSQDGAEPVL